ncbi:hypothetical protein [Nocardioides sp.]|uniref:hypothetical protein n=1 Tax=Nocardioides sp. TaxID=35761 RepID=UPI003514C657
MTEQVTEQDSATSGADETSVDTASEATATSADENALGDAGKKALDAMKAKWKQAEQQAKDTAAQLAAIQAKLDGTEAEHQKAIEAQKVRDEALKVANERIASAEIRAIAAGVLNDPADALAYISPSSFEVADDGSVDSESIRAAITDLISKKPYLAAQGNRFQGSADGGARKAASPKSVDEQIADAERAGDHKAASRLRAAQLLDIRNQTQ